MALGSAVLLAGTITITLRQRELFMVTMALGAASWLAGNLLWLGGASVPEVVALWVNFLVLTIAGERLELSRFLPPSPGAKRVFKIILAVLVAGSLLNVAGAGAVIYGIARVGAVAAALDVARRTVKEQGLTAYRVPASGYACLPSAACRCGRLTMRCHRSASVLMVFGHDHFPAVVRVKMPSTGHFTCCCCAAPSF
jgi:hypothetical protein